MLRNILICILAALLMVSTVGCTVSKEHVTTVMDLDQGKSAVYADVSQSFRNFAVALHKASPDGSVAKERAADVIAYLDRKDGDYRRLTELSVKAINALGWMDEAQRDKYAAELVHVLNVLKTDEGS
jgi:predicted lipoprotein